MADPSDSSDPYGIRGSANFADRNPALFGGPGANLTQIPLYGGGTVTVNKAAADSFRGFLGNLADLGYPLANVVQGYSDRGKVGGGRGISQHAYGNAIDVNPRANPQHTSQTDLPPNVSDLAAKWGLTWGGDWSAANRDPMHFEWAGINPTTGMNYRGQKPVQLAGNTMPSKNAPVGLQDARDSIFGPAPPKGAAPSQAATPAAQPVSSAPADAADPQTQIFGPDPAAPPAAPPPDDMGVTPAATPAAAVAPTPPSPPGWLSNPAIAKPLEWLVKQAAPFASQDNPLLHTALRIPLVDELSAGLPQGLRTAEMAQENVDKYLAGKDPTGSLTWVNRNLLSRTPESTAAHVADLQAQTKAYKEQYKGAWPASVGEFGGEMLGTPIAGLFGKGVGLAAKYALPMFGEKIIPGAAEWAGTSGLQNVLTSPDESPGEAFGSGAAGGGLLGGALKSTGAFLSQARTAVQKEAEKLGFKLSLGETWGGLAKSLESYSQYLPGSGLKTKSMADRANISKILTRQMGLPESEQITLGTMDAARRNAGALMDQSKNININGNIDNTLLTNLGKIDDLASRGEVPTINNLVTHIQNVMANNPINPGVLTGDELHNLIAHGGTLDFLIRNGTKAQKTLGQEIRRELQDAASRTADPLLYPNATAATKQAVDDFNRGRYNWKVIKTVEPLVNKTGSADDATYLGIANRIQGTPTNVNFDPRLHGPNDELQALARVLKGPLQDLKSSGTGRELTMARLMGLGGGIGAGEGGLLTAALYDPQNLKQYVAAMLAMPLAYGQAGRYSRLGLSRTENALIPRLAGPWLGNRLMGPEGGPNPAALQ